MSDRNDKEPEHRESQDPPTSQPIPAATLFQGRQQALIEHEGEIYRLVLTRNNKLLLQK
jgi:hemin uptake protein HemP